MSGTFEFHCIYCGKEFGSNVQELAKHIGRAHDPTRKKQLDSKNRLSVKQTGHMKCFPSETLKKLFHTGKSFAGGSVCA